MIYKFTEFKREDKKSPANSLRKLSGGWSQNEASEFIETIKCFEQIDEELWK